MPKQKRSGVWQMKDFSLGSGLTFLSFSPLWAEICQISFLWVLYGMIWIHCGDLVTLTASIFCPPSPADSHRMNHVLLCLGLIHFPAVLRGLIQTVPQSKCLLDPFSELIWPNAMFAVEKSLLGCGGHCRIQLQAYITLICFFQRKKAFCFWW